MKGQTCSTCRFLEVNGRDEHGWLKGQCHRYAPEPSENWYLFATLYAWMFLHYWRDDDELGHGCKSPSDIVGNYPDAEPDTCVHWPTILTPEEEWCGEWKRKLRPLESDRQPIKEAAA